MSDSRRERRVLNVGCGPRGEASLHEAFRLGGWREDRLDIDPAVEPDIVASVVDMRGAIDSGTYDAIWCSHNIEHLYAHEAPRAIAEFHRVLRRDGFALITCPDLEAIARLIVAGRFGQAIYPSRAGPIGVADMLWGHAQSIAEGRAHMAHRSGYTVGSLGDLLIAGGFAEAWVQPGVGFDLWAVALREEASPDDARRRLAWGGLHFSQESGDAA